MNSPIPYLPITQVGVWLAGLGAGLLGAATCVRAQDGRLHPILLGGSDRFDPISACLIPLALAGLTAVLVTNDGKDLLQSSAVAGRVFTSIMGPTLACLLTFLVTWSIAFGVGSPTHLVGARNYGLGLLLCSIARLVSGSALYGALGLLLLFPAFLPGTGRLGEVIGLAIWAPELPRDVILFVSASFGAIGVFRMRSRDVFRQRLDMIPRIE